MCEKQFQAYLCLKTNKPQQTEIKKNPAQNETMLKTCSGVKI